MNALAAALFLAASPCRAQMKPARPADSVVTVPQEGAAVAELSGTVESPAGAAWAKLARGQALAPGSQVRVGPGSSATLIFPDASKVRISANTHFTLESSSRKDISLFVKEGVLQAWVTKLRGRRFKIRSNAAVAAVRGTVLKYTVLAGGGVQIDLFTGKLDVSDAFGHPNVMSAGDRLTTDEHGSKTEDLPSGTVTPTEPKFEFTIAENEKGAGEGGQTTESEKTETEKSELTEEDSALPPPPSKNPADDLEKEGEPVSPSSPPPPPPQ